MCKCCASGGDGAGLKTKNEMDFRFRGLEIRQCKGFTFFQCSRGAPALLRRSCGRGIRTFSFLKRVQMFDKLECSLAHFRSVLPTLHLIIIWCTFEAVLDIYIYIYTNTLIKGRKK